MRFIYVDPDLKAGASVALCNEIVIASLRLGLDATILTSNKGTGPSGAIIEPIFSTIAEPKDTDPITGWLKQYYIGTDHIESILSGFGGIGPQDHFCVRISQSIHLGGVVRWFTNIPPTARPNVVAILDESLAVDVREEHDAIMLGLPEPGVDSRPVLYRFATRLPRISHLPRFHLGTFDLDKQRIYQALLDIPIDYYPDAAHAVVRSSKV